MFNPCTCLIGDNDLYVIYLPDRPALPCVQVDFFLYLETSNGLVKKCVLAHFIYKNVHCAMLCYAVLCCAALCCAVRCVYLYLILSIHRCLVARMKKHILMGPQPEKTILTPTYLGRIQKQTNTHFRPADERDTESPKCCPCYPPFPYLPLLSTRPCVRVSEHILRKTDPSPLLHPPCPNLMSLLLQLLW